MRRLAGLRLIRKNNPAGSIQRRRLALLRMRGKIRNPLFLGGAQSTERAKVAMPGDLGLEVPRSHAARHIRYPLSRSLQLELGLPGKNRVVPFEIVKEQRAYSVSPLLMRRHGID